MHEKVLISNTKAKCTRQAQISGALKSLMLQIICGMFQIVHRKEEKNIALWKQSRYE